MFFLAFDFCRFCVVIRFFMPTTTAKMTSDFKRFSIPDFIHYIYFSYLNSWERTSIFTFECWVLNKGTTGTIFITSLVWGGPWLGIEPGTSRTQSQHSTTRLSRRQWVLSSHGFVEMPFYSVIYRGHINRLYLQPYLLTNLTYFTYSTSILSSSTNEKKSPCSYNKCTLYRVHSICSSFVKNSPYIPEIRRNHILLSSYNKH